MPISGNTGFTVRIIRNVHVPLIQTGCSPAKLPRIILILAGAARPADLQGIELHLQYSFAIIKYIYISKNYRVLTLCLGEIQVGRRQELCVMW
jgi:hypothetical protein